MRSRIGWIAALAAFLAVPASVARAQYYYPPGYAGYGWGGWGGGASSLQGDVARGLGVFAAGAGQYNQQTAVANAINTQTAMQWNQYVWLSQQQANQRQYARMARNQQNIVRGREEVQRRLRNEPTTGDINRGDALNVALDEITSPQVYLKDQKGLAAKVPGTMIRDIPFQYASAAITTSVEQVLQGGPPPALKTPNFDPDRERLRAIRAELRKENEETGQFQPATLEKARSAVRDLRTKMEATYKRGSKERNESDRYLKSLYGLIRMLETPAINVLLAGVEKRPDTTLGDLLTFMKAFNLRFGVASTPSQRQTYQAIYPLLVNLRQEVEAQVRASAPTTAGPGNAQNPGEFFAGMTYEHLDAPKPPKPGNVNP